MHPEYVRSDIPCTLFYQIEKKKKNYNTVGLGVNRQFCPFFSSRFSE